MLFMAVISLGLLAFVHGQCALETIAFTAALSQDRRVPAGAVLIFDNAITNHGKAYDSSTGYFTAPVSGIYRFEVNFLTLKDTEGWLEIVLNQQIKVSAYAKQSDAYDSASNSVIVKMKEGDRVNVRARKDSGLYSRHDEQYTTFSGQYLARL